MVFECSCLRITISLVRDYNSDVRCGKTKIPPILKKREHQIDGFPRFVEPTIDAPCIPFFRSNVFKCRVHCGPGYKSTVPRVKCRKGELKNPAKGTVF